MRYLIHYTAHAPDGTTLDLILGPYTEDEALTTLQAMRRNAISTSNHHLEPLAASQLGTEPTP